MEGYLRFKRSCVVFLALLAFSTLLTEREKPRTLGKPTEHVADIWQNPPLPPSDNIVRTFGEFLPWLRVSNPHPVQKTRKPPIPHWMTLMPQQEEVNDVWMMHYPWHEGKEDFYETESEEDTSLQANLTENKDVPTIVVRTMKGVKRYRFRDTDLFGMPKNRTYGERRMHGTTSDFEDTEERDPGPDLRDPEKVIYDPLDWHTASVTDKEDEYTPHANELSIIYMKSRITLKEILHALHDYVIRIMGLKFKVLEHRPHSKNLRMNYVKLQILGMTKKEQADYEIIEFASMIKGVYDARIGPISNPEETKSSVDEQDTDYNEKEELANAWNEDETDEFSADDHRVKKFLDDKREDLTGRLYRKEEPSPWWSGRFPNLDNPPQFDLSQIRRHADMLTVYHQETDQTSAHYCYRGLHAPVLKVKWHVLPTASQQDIITVCGETNIVAFLDGRAVLLNSVKQHNNIVNSVTWNHVGTRFASASNDYRIMFFDKNYKCTAVQHDQGEVKAVTFDRSSEKVIFGGNAKRVNIWDLKSGPFGYIRSWNALYPVDFILTVKQNSSLIVTAGKGERVLDVWDIRTGSLVRQVRLPKALTDLRLSLTEEQIVAVVGKEVLVWNYTSPAMGTVANFAESQGFHLAHRVNLGEKIATAALDDRLDRIIALFQMDKRTVRGYDMNGVPLRTFIGHTKEITTVDVGPKGFIITGSRDMTVRLWPWPATEELLRVYKEFHTLKWKLPENEKNGGYFERPLVPDIIPADEVDIDLTKRDFWEEFSKSYELEDADEEELEQAFVQDMNKADLKFSEILDNGGGKVEDVNEQLATEMRDLDVSGGYNDDSNKVEDIPDPESEEMERITPEQMKEFLLEQGHAELNTEDEADIQALLGPQSPSFFSNVSAAAFKEEWTSHINKHPAFRAEKGGEERQYARAKRRAEKTERKLKKIAEGGSRSDTSPSDEYHVDSDGCFSDYSVDKSDIEKPRSRHPRFERLKAERDLARFYGEEVEEISENDGVHNFDEDEDMDELPQYDRYLEYENVEELPILSQENDREGKNTQEAEGTEPERLETAAQAEEIEASIPLSEVNERKVIGE
mmetsp:Transcript_19851/g.29690  ORF Transcript_19851/g.29690 Transcript_19851/m.29690 type:complete len:1083 (-) Transcript_19851:74-3322(-)